jgi:hypothetical protein
VCRLAHLTRGFGLSLGMRVERDLGKKQDAQHRQSEGKNPQQVTRRPAVTKHQNAYTLPQFEVGRYRACLVSKHVSTGLMQWRSEPRATLGPARVWLPD